MKSFAFPGLEAKILDGDVALEEHEDDDSEQADESNVDGWRNASAYIEAVSGATFAIEYTTNANFEYKNHDICMTILLDGKTVVTKVYSPGHSKRVVPGVDEPQNGGYCLRRFTFADLTTSMRARN